MYVSYLSNRLKIVSCIFKLKVFDIKVFFHELAHINTIVRIIMSKNIQMRPNMSIKSNYLREKLSDFFFTIYKTKLHIKINQAVYRNASAN